jgi:hypothetical protein
MAKLIISIKKIELENTTISKKAMIVVQDYIYKSVCEIFATKFGLKEELKTHLIEEMPKGEPFEIYWSGRYDHLRKQYFALENLEVNNGLAAGKYALDQWIKRMKEKFSKQIKDSQTTDPDTITETKKIDKFINGLLFFGIVFSYELKK